MDEHSRDEVFLVTGGAGLLGSSLLPMLARQRRFCAIGAVVRGDAIPEWISRLERVEVIHGDLRDAATWTRLPDTITRVFHLAATIERDPARARRATLVHDNLAPVVHLVERCRSWPRIRQVVYSSSISVFGPGSHPFDETYDVAPGDLYAASKLAGEHLLCPLRAQGVAVTCLRYTSLYGAGMHPGTVLPTMVRRALDGGEIVVHGQGLRKQDFLHAHDAARANLLAAERAADGVYNIGAGVTVSMAELARAVSRIFTDGRARVRFAADQPEGPPGYQVDLAKARRELRFCSEYDLDAGLRKLKETMGARTACT